MLNGVTMLVVTLIAAVAAVARLTRLLVSDQITVTYRQWVVRRFGPESAYSYLAHCPWCTSMWISAIVMPVAVAWPNRWVLAILAVPAASLITGLLLDGD